MSTYCRPALAALFALVVLCGQVFGLQRGFVCDCGGIEHQTALDHCHGLAEHEGHEIPAHHRDDHDEGDPVHDHVPLLVSQEAKLGTAAAFFYSQAPVLAFLPALLMSGGGMRSEKPADSALRRPESRAGPLWPPRLARMIALRI